MLRVHALALVEAGFVALPHKLSDLAALHPVLVQVTAGVVDHIQPAVTD